MFKIAIQNSKTYLEIIEKPFFKRFCVLKLTSITGLSDQDFIDCMSSVLVPSKIWMTSQKPIYKISLCVV